MNRVKVAAYAFVLVMSVLASERDQPAVSKLFDLGALDAIPFCQFLQPVLDRSVIADLVLCVVFERVEGIGFFLQSVVAHSRCTSRG